MSLATEKPQLQAWAQTQLMMMMRCKGTNIDTNVKYWWLSLNPSWGLIFCKDVHVCTIWKVFSINTEKEICLSSREYTSVYRWERINMVAKYIVHMHMHSTYITAELKADWLILITWNFDPITFTYICKYEGASRKPASYLSWNCSKA